MKVITYLSICMIVCSILYGCSNSGAPDCSDSLVKTTIIDSVEEYMRNEFMDYAIGEIMYTSAALQGNPTYEQWDRLKSSNPTIKKVIDRVDEYMESVGVINIKDIRTLKKNDETRLCRCGGTLTFEKSGKTKDIEYTAQYTDDGQIYVEVFGFPY